MTGKTVEIRSRDIEMMRHSEIASVEAIFIVSRRRKTINRVFDGVGVEQTL